VQLTFKPYATVDEYISFVRDHTRRKSHQKSIPNILAVRTMPSSESSNDATYSAGMTGSCLCGGVTVILKQDIFSKPNGHICYCDSCRKSTGTSGLNSLSTTKDKVVVRDPEALLSTYVDSATDSGRSVERHFCSRCGR
jgi:hypothetical protein